MSLAQGEENFLWYVIHSGEQYLDEHVLDELHDMKWIKTEAQLTQFFCTQYFDIVDAINDFVMVSPQQYEDEIRQALLRYAAVRRGKARNTWYGRQLAKAGCDPEEIPFYTAERPGIELFSHETHLYRENLLVPNTVQRNAILADLPDLFTEDEMWSDEEGEAFFGSITPAEHEWF